MNLLVRPLVTSQRAQNYILAHTFKKKDRLAWFLRADAPIVRKHEGCGRGIKLPHHQQEMVWSPQTAVGDLALTSRRLFARYFQ